jgi:hypothetical protein
MKRKHNYLYIRECGAHACTVSSQGCHRVLNAYDLRTGATSIKKIIKKKKIKRKRK